MSKISSPLLLLGSDVDEIWNASSAIDDIISHYKGESILFKKYHETGHMLTLLINRIIVIEKIGAY